MYNVIYCNVWHSAIYFRLSLSAVFCGAFRFMSDLVVLPLSYVVPSLARLIECVSWQRNVTIQQRVSSGSLQLSQSPAVTFTLDKTSPNSCKEARTTMKPDARAERRWIVVSLEMTVWRQSKIWNESSPMNFDLSVPNSHNWCHDVTRSVCFQQANTGVYAK